MKAGTKRTGAPEITAEENRQASAVMKENRREPRYKSSGTVSVELEGLIVSGRLVDVSASGFRMEHTGPQLDTGHNVRFTHPQASGTARVIWNRVSGGRTQTGFYVIG